MKTNKLLSFSDFLAEAAASTKIWRKGYKGDDFKPIQQKLIDLKLLKIKSPTGYFGDKTEAAVREFQKNNRLNIDGVIGSSTYSMLMKSKESVKEKSPGLLDTIMSWFSGDPNDAPTALAKKAVGTVEVMNPNANLLFNGTSLKWMVDGRIVKSWDAMSGISLRNTPPKDWGKLVQRYFSSPEEFSKEKDAGPIPPGGYTVGPIESRDPKTQKEVGFLDTLWTAIRQLTGNTNVKESLFQADTNYSRIAWGNFRLPITPKTGTNTYGRGSFYVHGGELAGSHGCIDLTDEMDDFAKFYQTWSSSTNKKKIDLTVNYQSDSNDSLFSKLFASVANQPEASVPGESSIA